MDTIRVKCESCGATIKVTNPDERQIACEYCGTHLVLKRRASDKAPPPPTPPPPAPQQQSNIYWRNENQPIDTEFYTKVAKKVGRLIILIIAIIIIISTLVSFISFFAEWGSSFISSYGHRCTDTLFRYCIKH